MAVKPIRQLITCAPHRLGKGFGAAWWEVHQPLDFPPETIEAEAAAYLRLLSTTSLTAQTNRRLFDVAEHL